MEPKEYIKRIRPLRNPEEIEAVCREVKTKLYGDGEIKDETNSAKLKTYANKLAPYNKLINNIPAEELIEGQNAFIYTKENGMLWKRHLHHKFLGLSKEQWRKINEKTIVLDRLENRRKVDVEQYLSTTLKLLQSNDSHELAVGLIAASGRRPIEILIRGNFHLTEELPKGLKHGYFVHFRGQAKKRDYDLPEEERVEYRIGVLVPAQFFLESFERFRKMPEAKELLDYLRVQTQKGVDPEKINDEIESRRGNSLRRVVRREFGAFLPARFGEEELDNKTLRAVYVRLITERDCPKEIDGLLWASRAVGHFVDEQKPDDSQLRHLSTTLGYSDYYVETEVPFIEAPQKEQKEKLANVKVKASDFEVIKQLQNRWDLPNQQSVIRYLIEKSSQIDELERQIIEKDTKIQDTAIIQENQQLKDENEKLRKELQKMTEKLQSTSQVQAQSSTPPTKEVQQPQAQPQELQDMVRQLITEELRKVLPQSQSTLADVSPTPTEETSHQEPEQKTKQPKPERDWSTVSNEELWASKARGATDEKILRAFQAVCDYNQYVATSNDERWFIGSMTLRALTSCNGSLVTDWINRHKLSVDDHNNLYELGQYHNKRHKKSITDVITLFKKEPTTIEESKPVE